MDSEKSAFIASIKDAPDDDAPRLIYADWLDEHGEPERAEFIRVQCEIDRRKDQNGNWKREFNVLDLPPILEREKELLTQFYYWDTLPFPSYCATLHLGALTNNRRVFRRGFIHSITCTAADWLQHGDAICERHPVREVRLTGELNPFEIGRLLAETGCTPELSGFFERGERAINDPTPLLQSRWPGVTFHLPNLGGFLVPPEIVPSIEYLIAHDFS